MFVVYVCSYALNLYHRVGSTTPSTRSSNEQHGVMDGKEGTGALNHSCCIKLGAALRGIRVIHHYLSDSLHAPLVPRPSLSLPIAVPPSFPLLFHPTPLPFLNYYIRLPTPPASFPPFPLPFYCSSIPSLQHRPPPPHVRPLLPQLLHHPLFLFFFVLVLVFVVFTSPSSSCLPPPLTFNFFFAYLFLSYFCHNYYYCFNIINNKNNSNKILIRTIN